MSKWSSPNKLELLFLVLTISICAFLIFFAFIVKPNGAFEKNKEKAYSVYPELK